MFPFVLSPLDFFCRMPQYCFVLWEVPMWCDFVLRSSLTFIALFRSDSFRCHSFPNETFLWAPGPPPGSVQMRQDPFPEEPHIKAFYPQTFHGVDKKADVPCCYMLNRTTIYRILLISLCNAVSYVCFLMLRQYCHVMV